MSGRNLSRSDTYLKQRKHLSMKHKPRMLKDCLLEDSSSCSSNGFKSFPRQPLKPNLVKPQPESKPHTNKPRKLLKGRSKALGVVINAVKSLHFSAVKSSSILPRSLSRRLSKKDLLWSKRERKETDVKITFRVKDIVRQRSSRDLIEDESSPSDFEPSPPHQRSTTTTITTTTTTASSISSTPCSSNGSSWCDSDFSSEFLPSWRSNCEEFGEIESKGCKKIYHVSARTVSREGQRQRLAL